MVADMVNKLRFVLVCLALMWSQTEANARCSACANREVIKEYKKNFIKNDILRKLGYESPPNITGAASIRSNRLIRSLIRKMDTDEKMQSDQPYYFSGDDMFQPDLVTVIPTKTPDRDVAELHWDDLYFPLSDWILQNRDSLTEANLLLHLPPAPSKNHNRAKVIVYYIGRDKNTNLPTQFRAKDETWKLREDRGGLVKIDLINLVKKKWLRNPSENMGIVIKAWSGDQVLEVPNQDSALAPYLQLHLNRSNNHQRYKRSTDMQCTEGKDSHVKECCKWPLTIEFRDFGWDDWIVSPTKYEANFCNGDCSLGVVAEAPHTHMMQMHSSESTTPCCSTSKWGDLRMMYLNADGNVVRGFVPGMVVEKCGCA